VEESFAFFAFFAQIRKESIIYQPQSFFHQMSLNFGVAYKSKNGPPYNDSKTRTDWILFTVLKARTGKLLKLN